VGGVEYEGEEPPQASDEDLMANRVASLLANGSGGFDWSGLPLLVGWLGVRDVEGLLMRLAVIRLHKPETAGKGAA
jgi:hypothetical protein